MIGSFGKRKIHKNKRNILKTLPKNGALFRALYPHYRGNAQKMQAPILGQFLYFCFSRPFKICQNSYSLGIMLKLLKDF
jgi:hypothetical protein